MVRIVQALGLTTTRVVIAALFLVTAGNCLAEDPTPRKVDRATGFSILRSWANSSPASTRVQVTAKECIDLLAKNDLQRASKKCNQALSLNIQDTRLQLLNGFVYHLQFLDGDNEKAALVNKVTA